MQIYLSEKIGNPELFTGRRKELSLFLKWIDGIKRQTSKSTAILSRRKTGKTALLQRLYNIVFHNNDGVIPFYYEIREGKQWAITFCEEFFLTFIYQYVAFKTRKKEYFTLSQVRTFEKASKIVKKEGLTYLIGLIEDIYLMAKDENVDRMWSMVRDTPRTVAEDRDERIVQIIDEFQYLNSEIYWDKEKINQANDFAGGYMSTAEYRNAPLLISGSWVGWLRYTLHTMLPSRFRHYFLEDLPEEEAVEMIFKYSQILKVPVSEEIAYLIAQLSEGNPFYISALFYSFYPGKDFTNAEGLINTLEFETLNDQGEIKGTWAEYIFSTFARVNERHAKNIVLYLSQHRDREISRKELLKSLNLKMTDFELEQKLHALVKSDIINQGRSNFYYQGVQDNIFDKVFRGMFADDIQEFDPQEITNEYRALFEDSQRRYRELLGKYNYTKGYFAEFLIINQLRFHAYRNQDMFQSMIKNLPEDFRFVRYKSVWSYKTSQADKPELNIDVFARAPENEYSLICEVKNRDTKKFSTEEAAQFLEKVRELKEIERVSKTVPFVFSLTGFTQDALEYCKSHHIAWSDDQCWLEQA